jgi:drug/metabolite transporter (DMT)-like permease
LQRNSAIALTLVTAILWGTSFPAVSIGIKNGLNPVSFVFFRFGIASIPMVLVTLATGRKIRGLFRNKYCIILGIINTFSFILQFEGQVYASASLSALIVNMSALVAASGSAIFLKERFGKLKIVAVISALIGVTLLTTDGSIVVSSSQLLGIIFLSMTAFSWGAYVIIDKTMLQKTRIEPLPMTTFVVIVTTILTAPFLLLYGYEIPGNLVSWYAVLYTALVNTAIPYAIYQVSLEYLSATISSIILLVEPVVAIFISSFFLGERMDTLQLLGAALVLASIFLVSLSEDRS